VIQAPLRANEDDDGGFVLGGWVQPYMDQTIADTRATSPGLRLLERYAVELGGGYNSRFGLDDGVVVTANHISIVGEVTAAVRMAKEKLGYLHKIAVEVSNENEVKDAVKAGADAVLIADLSSTDFARFAATARELSSSVAIECLGKITPAIAVIASG